jgi:hypothetical protein
VSPCSINERIVNVDAGDGAWVEGLCDSDGDMAVVGADIEHGLAPEEGVWEGIEAEERAFFVVMEVVSVDWSHIG